MIFEIVAFVGLVASVLAYKYRTQIKAEVTKVEGGTSAFAKLSEADGKLIALKVATDAKKAEAAAAHDSLDELHKILG